jgi:hypothetical protein
VLRFLPGRVLCCSAAVDGDDGAGDEAGLVGEEVGDGRGDLVGAADAAEGVQLGHLLPGGGFRPLLGEEVW